VALLVGAVAGQNWREVVPLRSTCKDIKQIFTLRECKIPVTSIDSSDLSFDITFSNGKDTWKVLRGTVVNMNVRFRHLPKLTDFETNLDCFVIVSVDDLPNARIYENKKRGMSIHVQKIFNNSDDEYVTVVRFYPPVEARESKTATIHQMRKDQTSNLSH
jgi:hypothetical protein